MHMADVSGICMVTPSSFTLYCTAICVWVFLMLQMWFCHLHHSNILNTVRYIIQLSYVLSNVYAIEST